MNDAMNLNIQCLQKGKEIYVFLYPDEQRSECIRTLGRFASNPDLSFSWYDAAKVSQAIKREAKGALRD